MRIARTGFARLFGILLLLAGWTALPVEAASQCKGLSQSQCERSDVCTWVGGYTSKSGNKVSSYCRAKPKKGGAAKRSGGHAKEQASSGAASKPADKTQADPQQSKKEKKKKDKKDKKDKKTKKASKDKSKSESKSEKKEKK